MRAIFVLLCGCLLALQAPERGVCEEVSRLPDWIQKNHLQWQPPPEGVVRDGNTAIIIAHAIWSAEFPSNAKQIGTEEDWQSHMVATLHKGVWEVTGKGTQGGVGGGLFFYIDKKDGRLLGIFLTQ